MAEDQEAFTAAYSQTTDEMSLALGEDVDTQDVNVVQGIHANAVARGNVAADG